MRILTVRQPWAWAIIHGGKDVENRVRNIAGDYRGPVAIHVGLAFPYTRDCQAVERITGGWPPVTDGWDRVQGAGHIIGVVDLADVHHVTLSTVPRRYGAPVCWDSVTGAGVLCSPWAESMSDGYHLELTNPRPLAEPIPFKGALGLRRLDADTTARVFEAVAS